MRRLLSNKLFIVILTSLLLLSAIILSCVPDSPVKNILKPVGAIVSPIQRGIKDLGNQFTDFWVAITDGIAIRQENEELREEIIRLEYLLTRNEEARIRYEELMDAFHIRDTFSNFEIYGATILSRESDEWFSVIRIALGLSDGIPQVDNNSYVVVDPRMNLVGRIIEINNGESTILPILHEGFVVVGKVNEVNGATVTITGDAALKRDELCLVTNIDENVILEVGDEIVTSGEGGLFPQGIPIGVIESVDYSDPLNITATLRPYSNIGSLNDVFVMVPINAEELSEQLETSQTEETEADS